MTARAHESEELDGSISGPVLPLNPDMRWMHLLDHLVSAGEQRRRHYKSERLPGFKMSIQMAPAGMTAGAGSALRRSAL
jgi:hypothetical protein